MSTKPSSNGVANGHSQPVRERVIVQQEKVHTTVVVKEKKSAARKWGIRALVVTALAVVYNLMNMINHHFYALRTDNLHSIALRSIEHATSLGQPNNATMIVSHILDLLVKENPNVRLNTDFQNKGEWVFNNAGGAMGSMYLIHASITEYLLIFGSAVGIEGHTGRHTADDYFHILTGRQTAYEAGALVQEEYLPGDMHHLRRGVVKQYVMEPESWALEYARGWIPLMVPFGIADTVFSTMDVITLWHTIRLTGREMILNLLRGKI